MYSTFCTHISKRFRSELVKVENLPTKQYAQLVGDIKERYRIDVDADTDTDTKSPDEVTVDERKCKQFHMLRSVLKCSGELKLPVNDTKDAKTYKSYTFAEVERAFQGTGVPVFKNKPHDKEHDSCIQHGGYTVVRKMDSESWYSSTRYEVKDANGNRRFIQVASLPPKIYKHADMSRERLEHYVRRYIRDDDGVLQQLAKTKVIPRVHHYFVCFSPSTWGHRVTPKLYIVLDYLENVMGLTAYMKKYSDELNDVGMKQVGSLMRGVIKRLLTKTAFRIKGSVLLDLDNRINYSDFMVQLHPTTRSITNMYLKNIFSHIQHDEEEAEGEVTRQKNRVKKIDAFDKHIACLLAATQRTNRKMQFNVAIGRMVEADVLGFEKTASLSRKKRTSSRRVSRKKMP
jgi:hypothetical protein